MSAVPQAEMAARLARWQGQRQLGLYRDDGPLARFLGSALGGFAKLPPLALVLVGVAGVIALAAIEGDGASDAAVAIGVAWLVLWAGPAAGRPYDDSVAWAVPAVLRVGEYGGLIWIAACAGGSSSAAAFALVAALAFRHYDLVYRPRFLGVSPAGWLAVAGGGWEGRLIVVTLLLLAGALPAGLFIMAGALGVMFLAESVSSWGHAPDTTVSSYEDEEDEGD